MDSARQDAQGFFSPVVPGGNSSHQEAKEREHSVQEADSFFSPVLPARKESKSNGQEAKESKSSQQESKERRSSVQEADSFFSPVLPMRKEGKSSDQEANERKSSVQEADSFFSPVVARGNDSRSSHKDSKSSHQEAKEGKTSDQEAKERKSSVQEADSFLSPVVARGNDSRSSHKDSKSSHQEAKESKSSHQDAKERKSSVQEAESFLAPVVARGKDSKSNDDHESEEWYDSVKEQAATGTRGVDLLGSKGEADSWLSPVTTGTKSKASEAKPKASEADHSKSPPTTTRVSQLSANLGGQHRPSRKELDAANKDAPPPRDGPKNSEVILSDKEFGASLASAFSRKPPRPAVSGPHAKSNQEKEDEAAGYDQGRDQKEVVPKEAVDKARRFEKDGKQKTAHEIIEEDKKENYGFGRRLQDLIMGPVGLGALCAVVAWKVVSARRGHDKPTRVNRRIEIHRKVEVY